MSGNGAHRAAIKKRSDALYTSLRRHVEHDGRLAVVKAPPGSGKTHTLLRLVAAAYAKRMRVAVGTQTNAQANDVCKRLATDHPDVRVVRFAANGMQPVSLGKSVRWETKESELPAERSVVVGTVAKWSLVNLTAPFSVLVIDEAWQMSWSDFMLCGQVSENFVLIGDPGQIPPVVTIPVERWETSPRAPHQPAPELILADPSIERLEDGLPACRRLPADAVDLVRPFYDFPFDAWAEPGERQVRIGKRVGGRDPVDVALDLLPSGSGVVATLPTPADGPPLECDEEVAALAARLVERLLERGARVCSDESGRLHTLKPEQIGMVATHRIMNSAMEQALPPSLRRKVQVDTPERWQGLERDVMVVVHPLSGVVHPSAFDLETGRLCVMASRHRAGMIVVSRDHVPETLASHIPFAEQAVGRPDITGRGHDQHIKFWSTLADQDRVAAVR